MDQKMSVCLWFDHEAEAAANFYTSIFKNSSIGTISHYGDEGFEIHGQHEGTVMVVSFRINGMDFLALNGGPLFRFNESISVVVYCDTQQEIDYYWDKLTEGGEESACGWLKDRYGVSWQITPSIMPDLLSDADPKKAARVMHAFMQMKKFDIAKIRQAANGE